MQLCKLRKTSVFLLFICLCSSSLFAQISKSASFLGKATKEIVAKCDDGKEYSKIQMDGLELNEEPGKPVLPVKIVRLLISANQKISDVHVLVEEAEIINLKKQIIPGQPPKITGIDLEKREFVKPDSNIYGSDKPYPEKPVRVINDGYFDGNNHIITILICPIQYFPKSGYIKKYTSVQYSLTGSAGFRSNSFTISRTKDKQEIYDHILENIVDNPEAISSYQIKATLISKSTSSSISNSAIQNSISTSVSSTVLPFYEYVIITPNSFKTAFNNFVSWKRRKGINIGVVTTEEIFANYSGDLVSGIYDDAGKIRQYLNDGYASGVTVYALLGGKSDYVPVRKGYGGAASQTVREQDAVDSFIPTDLYFADFNGNWNYDYDGNYGERDYMYFGDKPDYYPEIFVGRLLCTNTQDILNWTTKVLRYEQNPGNGHYSYLSSSLMHESDDMQDNAEAESVASYLPLSFSNTLLKEVGTDSDPNTSDAEDPDPSSPTGSQIISLVNQNGYGFWGWFNHGIPIGITVKTGGYNATNRWHLKSFDSYSLTAGDVNNGLNNLNNASCPGIIYAISCQITPFDYYDPKGYWPNTRNMGESFTVCSQNGGVALLGNTRFGFVDNSYKMAQKFLQLVGTSGNEAHLGPTELMSKCTAQIPYFENYHYLNYSHNLVGCPEMQMWTSYPSIFDQIEISMTSSSISVNSCATGSNICATDMSTGSSYFSVAKNVTSNDFSTSVRPLYITVTKHNYIPSCYKTNFTSSVSGPATRTSSQNGTWTVSVSGGTSPYHYKWYYRHLPADPIPGSPTYWVEIGSDSTQLTRRDSCDFNIRCVVTDAEGFKSIDTFCYISVSVQANKIADNNNKIVAPKIPIEYSIASFPNPFNPTAIINYSVANTEHVTVKIFNILSQEVATLVNETKAAGTYQARFNANNLPSGIYIARIQSGSYTKSIKMQLVK